MTRIKICGITNLDDARAAVDYGADALGLIFVPDSPRLVGEEAGIRKLLEQIPPFTARVGVCLEPSQIPRSHLLRLSAIQYYSEVWQTDLDAGTPRIRALRVKANDTVEDLLASLRSDARLPSAVLLDTYHKEKLGGSGAAFDWRLATEACRKLDVPLILAGGLTPENVEEAIAGVRPYAVDVSSGVEADPGRKDHARLKAFIRAVRRADAALESITP